MVKKDDKKNQNTTKKVPQTMGHEWDGISEYNIPAPRWWLIVWLICIIHSVGYWFLYPTWPTPEGHTKGSLNWTQQSQLAESQQEISNKRDILLNEVSKLSFKEIQNDPTLMEFALNGGESAFKENCAACHGTGAQGAKGYPNLNDDDWLWGGKITDIHQTIKFGIRSEHEDARFSQMPAFGLDKTLNKKEIESVAQYVMSLSDSSINNPKGKTLFKENCSSCHGPKGKGDRSVGAPNLSDAIWLYGDKEEDIIFTITHSRSGVMPYWNGRLSNSTIKQLAIYIHAKGGGE